MWLQRWWFVAEMAKLVAATLLKTDTLEWRDTVTLRGLRALPVAFSL